MATTPRQYIERIDKYIGERRLRDAFVQVRALAGLASDWRLTEEIDRLEQTYRMMLDYASKGHADPGRDNLYALIVAGLRGVADRAVYRIERRDSPTMYYSTLRYEALQHGDTMRSLLDRYLALADRNSAFNAILGENGTDKKSDVAEREALERRIFMRLWVAYPLSAELAGELGATLDSEAFNDDFKSLLISSLLLGLLAHYDERRLTLLLDVYSSGRSSRLAMQALCAALMAMYICRKSVDAGRLKPRIDALRDTTTWSADVQKVFMQFLRSRDTDRVAHTINDDLIPRLRKLRPEMLKHDMDASSIEDLQELMSDNPEWNDMLRDSGVADKLKELMKMQEEGADVMMPTFAQLKTFPFFHEPANWFVPFRADHTAITGALGDEAPKIGGLIAAAPFLCDGDKYSFCLALAVAPEVQRRVMLSQINPEALSQLEMRQATIDAAGDVSARETAAAKYVQSLYRFFKLFRRKGEFSDPFERPLNLLVLPLLAPDLHSPETLGVVGEFYFQRGYYEDAAEVLRMRAASGPVDAQLFQKLGYSCQQTGSLEDALQYYSQAELLNADSLWTRRRLGAVCRLLGRTEEALAHFRIAEKARPDDGSIALNIGHCLVELGRHKEALNYFFKAEFVGKKPERAIRPLAWSLLLSGDTTRAREYYSRLLSANPTYVDYMNAGYAATLDNDMPEAVNLFALSADNFNGEFSAWLERFRSSLPALYPLGLDPLLPPLVVDTLLYRREQ
ncbi:tetratricopeptide repeat protein [uncultured Muribaculum sp.]|uniref:tetratricopeptide repeat protein n=1 Tax=uncultured Muribaculum sp. TaxID=1918613 RepID=UPI0025CDB941|nr:tetratricopeptide repeat protein [uncultured Muribaculum sp.]